MADQTGSTGPRSPWESPAVVAALISGSFAFLGTVTTAAISWRNRPDNPEPPVPVVATEDIASGMSPVASVSQLSGESVARHAAGLQELRPLADDPPSTSTSQRDFQESANWLLNFAAFQQVMKDRQTSDADKERVVQSCSGRTVIWEGYVDRVSPHSELTADSAVTVTLCESAGLLTQSMFKQPAICRFSVEGLDQLQRIKTGEKVTLSGRFVSHSALGTILENCEIVGGATQLGNADRESAR